MRGGKPGTKSGKTRQNPGKTRLSCSSNADTTVDCQIGLIFQPGHPGADASSLLITGTGTGASVGLNGSGTAGSVSIDPGSASILANTLSTSAQQVAVDRSEERRVEEE